jgi:DNA-binding beta-propeller fold protein YncE
MLVVLLCFVRVGGAEEAPDMLERIQDIATGGQPKSAYFSPDGGRVFVPLLLERGVDVFAFEGGVLRRETRLSVPGSTATGFVEAMIDERRGELWVSNMEENKAHIFDLSTLAYKTAVGTGGMMPKVIAASPDGSTAAVSNWLSGTVAFIDMDAKKLLWTIKVGVTPRGLAFSPDGALLYAAIFDKPEIAVIDVKARKVAKRFRYFDGAGAARHVIYRNGVLIVSDMYRGAVCLLDADTGRLVKSARIGANLNTIVLSADGSVLFASSRGRNNPVDYTKPGPEYGRVFALSPDDLAVLDSVSGKNQPTGLAASPDGAFLVFTNFLDADMELLRVHGGR